MIKKYESIEKMSIIYLRKNLERLAASFNEQHADIEDFARWNLANDIASDWENYEDVIKTLLDSKLISEEMVVKFKKMVGGFEEVCYDGPKFEEVIWTIQGVENHPFWAKQRILAKELLEEFNKINL